jgi:hypothetical protein
MNSLLRIGCVNAYSKSYIQVSGALASLPPYLLQKVHMHVKGRFLQPPKLTIGSRLMSADRIGCSAYEIGSYS